MGLGTQEDDRIRIFLGAKESQSDSSTKCLTVGVVATTWDQDHYGIRVPMHYMKERHGNRHTSAAIQWLRYSARVVHIP
jgi:hypothetical protein